MYPVTSNGQGFVLTITEEHLSGAVMTLALMQEANDSSPVSIPIYFMAYPDSVDLTLTKDYLKLARERIAGLVEKARQTILNIPADWSDEDILSFAVHYMTINRRAIEEEMEERLNLTIHTQQGDS